MPKTPPHKMPAHKSKPKKKSTALTAAGRQELARLRNIQVNQYGAPGDQNYLKKLALAVQHGNKTPGSQDWKVRAGKATRSRLALRAGKTVQAELNPQIAAAKNYESGLKNMYAQLAGTQQQAQQQMAQQQQSSAAKVGSNYDQLASNVASDFRAGREGTSDELARLGLQGGVSDQNSESLQSLLTGLAQSGKANAAASENMQGGAAQNLMSLLGQESANTGATLSAASSQNRGSLEASRAGKVYGLWNQLIDQRKAQKAQTQQQRFLNRITRAKLGASTDLSNAQSLAALGSARKSIVDSRRPTLVKKPKIYP